jgi:hypothetical protein
MISLNDVIIGFKYQRTEFVSYFLLMWNDQKIGEWIMFFWVGLEM